MFLQKQLADAKRDLQAFQEKQTHDDNLRDIEIGQQRDRNLRLENIIAACVELISSRGGLPNSLRKMIDHDAPGALTSTEESQTVSKDVIPGATTTSNESAFLGQTSTTIRQKPVAAMKNEVHLHTMATNDGLDFTTNAFSSWPPESCFGSNFFLDAMGDEPNIL
jgi:hypothetical protein